MGISLKELKKYKQEQSKVFELDFETFVDPNLKGVVVPIKIKSFEETLKLKESFVDTSKPTVEYKVFRKAGKKFREFYNNSIPEGRKGVPTYVQICRYDKDEFKFEIKDFRNRLFEVLIHFDMDYEIEEGKTLWDDVEIKQGDYNELVNLFSSLIFEETHLRTLEIVVNLLKEGVRDVNAIKSHVGITLYLESINKIEDKEEREEKLKEFKEQYEAQIKLFNEIQEKQKDLEVQKMKKEKSKAKKEAKVEGKDV